MISAIDTNILLDILIPDERYTESSKNLIEKFKEKGKLQICEIVYSELASQFPLSDELELFLQETGINLEHSNRKALSIAGERWKKYPWLWACWPDGSFQIFAFTMIEIEIPESWQRSM